MPLLREPILLLAYLLEGMYERNLTENTTHLEIEGIAALVKIDLCGFVAELNVELLYRFYTSNKLIFYKASTARADSVNLA